MQRQLPNMLSVFRILLAVPLLLLYDRAAWFFLFYLLSGLTDVLDGYLARRWRVESTLGAKLDSLGDIVFFGIASYILLVPMGLYKNKLLLVGYVLVFLVRAANFVITRVRFGEWGLLHSLGNKTAGLLLFLLLPIAVLYQNAPFGYTLVTGIVALLSAMEETVLLFRMKVYDPDRKTIFLHKK